MRLTVVLVTFNRKKVLKKLLKTFLHQTDKDFEVVVVSDGSIDGTHEWLEKYKNKAPFELRWFDTGLTDRYGLAIARNIGIREARGEAVLILDDDTFPTEHLVEEHKKSVKSRVLTGGWMQHTDPYENRDERMREYLEVYGDCDPKEFTILSKQKYEVENNTCMYKQDWIDVGLFNEKITGYGEIGEIFERLKAMEYKYQFNPRAKIIHKDEYKRSYGRFKKTPHTIPVWLKRFVHPIKQLTKKYVPGLYQTLKRLIGRSI